MNKALRIHTDSQATLSSIQKRVHVSLDTLGNLSATLKGEELETFLKGQYENYDAILQEHKVAEQALAKCKKALARCAPEQVALDPQRVTHMQSLGYDMSQYPQKEVQLAASCTQLEGMITNLQQLVTTTEAYISALPGVLDVAARHARQSTRKGPTYGDRVPDTLGGAKGYFLKGLHAYHDATSGKATSGKPSTPTLPSNTPTLNTPSHGIDDQSEGKR